MSDYETIERCRRGETVKYVGHGLVVMNYDWWIKFLEKQGYFMPAPNVRDVLDSMIDINTVADYLTSEMIIPPQGTVPAGPETRRTEWVEILMKLK